MTLSSGRTLGYTTHDSAFPSGPIVLLFHGSLSSRLESSCWVAAARSLSANIVGVDRPGIGLSSLAPAGYSFADWAVDIQELVDHLGAKGEAYYVLGVSGGGTYALACGLDPGSRAPVTVGVVAGVEPPAENELVMEIDSDVKLETDMKNLAELCRGDRQDLQEVIEHYLIDFLPEADRKVFECSDKKSWLAELMRDALGPGHKGSVADMMMNQKPWDFQLKDVKVPTKLWYGGMDEMEPPRVGEHLARKIPHSRLTVFEAESHFSILFNKQYEILRNLLAP